MAFFSWTKLILGVFIAYFLNSIYVIHTLFNPEECNLKKEMQKCIEPSYKLNDFKKMKV